MPDVPRAARYQAGAFTRQQARDEGWSRNQLEWRLRSGAWQVLCGAALVAGNEPPHPLTWIWAIHLTWPTAVASHLTAAAFHRFPVPPAADSAAAHAIVPAGLGPVRGIVTHRLPIDRSELLPLPGGVAATSRLRTAVDLLRWLPFQDALDLHAWTITHGVLDRSALSAEVRATTGRRGTPQLMRILDATRGGALSGAEARLHDLLRRAGVTGWTANAKLRLPSGPVVVDLLFEAARVVIEVDGWASHSSKESFQRDRERQNALVGAGYLVLRFTWDDLTRRPDAVLRQIAEAVTARTMTP